MFKDVKELKDLLSELGYEDTVVFENPSWKKIRWIMRRRWNSLIITL